MTLPYYRLSLTLVASLSLLLAGCGSNRAASPAVPAATPPKPSAAANPPDEIDTESTIWTVLGIAKKPSETPGGPQTGPQVSPILWEAAHDALNFVKVSAEDPISGVMETDWYSPPNKPDERLRVSVFILSRALRSDSVSVTIERQARAPGGQWQPSTVDRDVITDLETAILLRARHIHAERYANQNYSQTYK